MVNSDGSASCTIPIPVPAENGSPLYIWGHTPWPRCGGREHISRTPTVPESYKDTGENPVTFNNWNTLPGDEKAETAERIANVLFKKGTD